MSFINSEIRKKIDATDVSVFFVNGAVTKWYNARRTDPLSQVCLLGGWYWTLGTEENGPFRTPSAAQRDFYYRKILRIAPPALNEHEVRDAQKELQSIIANAKAQAKAQAKAKAKRRTWAEARP